MTVLNNEALVVVRNPRYSKSIGFLSKRLAKTLSQKNREKSIYK